MAWRQALRRVGGLTVASVIIGLWPAAATAADTVAFTIRDSRITESSGLATDSKSDLYWTVNDSGDTGMAYGITDDGKVKGTLQFRVAPIDIEAVAMNENRLYIGDIGDNRTERREVTVYYFDDPGADDQTTTYNSWDFRYPDGEHDAETLLVSSTGRLYIVTKGAKGGIYAAPKEPSSVQVNKLTKVGTAPGIVTDGVFLPDDKSIALLTYSSVEVIDAKTYKKIASATIPKQKQAESLTLSLDGESLLVGSEGKNSKVYSMAVPAAATPSPTPSTADDSGDDPADDDTAADAASGNKGTFLALGVAAFVAVVAGAVVGFVRRPGHD